MGNFVKKVCSVFIGLTIVGTLISCSGGGSSSNAAATPTPTPTAQGLKMPASVSVVSAK